jgi:hypothetical protein
MLWLDRRARSARAAGEGYAGPLAVRPVPGGFGGSTVGAAQVAPPPADPEGLTARGGRSRRWRWPSCRCCW